MSDQALARLRDMLRSCTLCPRRCGADRTEGSIGACGVGETACVASAVPHFGEEPVLVGRGGSGTILLAGCALHCVFCQNHDISQGSGGYEAADDVLASLALDLEARGCANVNFVTPTHVAHAVAAAIAAARARGLAVPAVYNCGGYESVETLELLAGLVDIYMPDFKYADRAAGLKYSGAPDYPATAEAALIEMYRQVGPLRANARGIATRGVLVRHLVLPHDLARSRSVIDTVARAAPGTTINVMAQYHPCYRAAEFPELVALPRRADIAALRSHATSLGLTVVE